MELNHEIDQGDLKQIEAELGDVFFSLVNYARFLGVNPDDALATTNKKFRARFEAMEKIANARKKQLSNLSSHQWETLWNEAKKTVG